MGRKAGSVMRCVCRSCGAVEVRSGCNDSFRCASCDPTPRRDSPKYQAHKAVADAIRRGQLARPSIYTCVDCGAPAIEYEHRDYSKPLEVEPVCRRCNLLRGPALNTAPSLPPAPERATSPAGRVAGGDLLRGDDHVKAHAFHVGCASLSTPIN